MHFFPPHIYSFRFITVNFLFISIKAYEQNLNGELYSDSIPLVFIIQIYYIFNSKLVIVTVIKLK
jgi:hypothetical protein